MKPIDSKLLERFENITGKSAPPVLQAHRPKKDRPRCGAKTRAGGECQAPCVKGRARCRRHGGLTPRNELRAAMEDLLYCMKMLQTLQDLQIQLLCLEYPELGTPRNFKRRLMYRAQKAQRKEAEEMYPELFSMARSIREKVRNDGDEKTSEREKA